VPNSVSPQFPNGPVALYRYSLSSNKAEELVENVEDMDVLYGVGAGGAMAGGTFKRADTMTAADWSNVISVRVSVVGVGDQLGAAPTPQTVQVQRRRSGWIVAGDPAAAGVHGHRRAARPPPSMTLPG